MAVAAFAKSWGGSERRPRDVANAAAANQETTRPIEALNSYDGSSSLQEMRRAYG